MVKTFSVSTNNRTEMVDITSNVQEIIQDSKQQDALCTIFIPHTTAGITINENADPSVHTDILTELNKIVPFDDNYSHTEGNSSAHIKSSMIGSSINVIIEDGKLKLGTWQGIYFCEFDGPRTRKVWVKII